MFLRVSKARPPARLSLVERHHETTSSRQRVYIRHCADSRHIGLTLETVTVAETANSTIIDLRGEYVKVRELMHLIGCSSATNAYRKIERERPFHLYRFADRAIVAKRSDVDAYLAKQNAEAKRKPVKKAA